MKSNSPPALPPAANATKKGLAVKRCISAPEELFALAEARAHGQSMNISEYFRFLIRKDLEAAAAAAGAEGAKA